MYSARSASIICLKSTMKKMMFLDPVLTVIALAIMNSAIIGPLTKNVQILVLVLNQDLTTF